MSQPEINHREADGQPRERAGAGNAIEVRDLRKRFGQQQVLDGVTLDFPAGEITTIVGPSGSGKTVLLKHLNLLLRPDSGTIVIDGDDVTKLSGRALDRVREKLGMLFQSGALRPLPILERYPLSDAARAYARVAAGAPGKIVLIPDRLFKA